MSGTPRPRRRFPVRLERSWRIPLLLWGVRPSNAYIDLDDERMDAHFGVGSLATGIANIASYERTGPWSSLTAFGIRRGIRGGDASYCGTARYGVYLRFREGVRWGPIFRPHALTVTPEDADAFERALEERGIPRYAAPTRSVSPA